MRKIIVAAWRNDADGPMQVVSGPVGQEKLHYEAPAAPLLEQEMSAFLPWANDSGDRMDAVLRAALAHLWFVTIHPFDDGNGRITRAIADWALARSENSPQRFSRACLRWNRSHARRSASQGPVLGEACRHGDERSAAQHSEQTS
jgi:Fic family protein